MQVLQIVLLLLGTITGIVLLKILYRKPFIPVIFTVNVDGIIHILKGKYLMTNATIDNTVTVSAAFTDSKGNAVAPATAPVWTIDNTAVATLAPSADGLSVTVNAVGPVGTVVVTVTDGNITANTSITFLPGAPVSVVLTETVSTAPVAAAV